MRLIDADALMEGRVCNDPVVIAARCATAVDPVKHGKWIFKGTSIDGKKVYECSVCHTDIYATGNFCKECGARMDGEV